MDLAATIFFDRAWLRALPGSMLRLLVTGGGGTCGPEYVSRTEQGLFHLIVKMPIKKQWPPSLYQQKTGRQRGFLRKMCSGILLLIMKNDRQDQYKEMY